MYNFPTIYSTVYLINKSKRYKHHTAQNSSTINNLLYRPNVHLYLKFKVYEKSSLKTLNIKKTFKITILSIPILWLLL